MPSLALIFQLIDAVDAGTRGPVARPAAERATAWCTYLEAHARRLYAMITDAARVAAAVLAIKITHGRVASPFTAREVYRNEWTGLTEPRVVQVEQRHAAHAPLDDAPVPGATSSPRDANPSTS